MLNSWQSVLLVILVVAGSLSLLFVLHRMWPIEQRRPNNDLIGWNITVLGTTYAVIIAFMLYAAWTNFEVANGNTEAEANSLVNVARSAQGLPTPQKQRVLELALEYARLMLVDEWPAMSRASLSPASARITRELWEVLIETQTKTASEQASRDHALTELSRMTDNRRLRQLEAISDLPGILWTVLVAGAIVTIISACLFGSADFKLHLIQVTALSLVISLVLVSIADINRPFQWAVRVPPTAFEHARATLNELTEILPTNTRLK